MWLVPQKRFKWYKMARDPGITNNIGIYINKKGLTQKVSFCFLRRVKFRKVMLEKLNPSHSCGAGPPVHKARALKKRAV